MIQKVNLIRKYNITRDCFPPEARLAKGGIKDAKKAFLQIAAIQLSGDNVLPIASV